VVGWLREPRNLILLAGGLTLAGLWCAGGVRWGAVATMLVGLAVGGGMIWGVRAGASLAMGREAMGMGDVTLMAMIGAWLGWQACMLVLYCTVFVGLAHALVHLLLRGETEFPFGPSLCLATALVVLFWRPLWAATGVHLADPALIAVLAAFVIVGSAGCLWALRAFRERDRARP
jgi:leader peptidase (prepilin peptidase)/N-methyltransferase